MKVCLGFLVIAAFCIFAFVQQVNSVLDSNNEYTFGECNQHCPKSGDQCGACCQDAGFKAEFSSCRSRRCLCRLRSLYIAETFEGFEEYGGDTSKKNHPSNVNSAPSYESKPTTRVPVPTYSRPGPPPTTRASTYSPPAPRATTRAPTTRYFRPTPQPTTRAPTYFPTAPKATTRSPTYSPPAPKVTTRVPTYSPPAPKATTRVPTYSPPAPRATTRAPTYSPPAPKVTTRAPTYTRPTPQPTTKAPTYYRPEPKPTTRAPTYISVAQKATSRAPIPTSYARTKTGSNDVISPESCAGLCPRQEYNCSKCCRDAGYNIAISGCHSKKCICH